MNDPEAYAAYSDFQRKESSKVFDEFLKSLSRKNQWKTLLDVGTGPGNFLVENVLKAIDEPIPLTLGIDVSKKMIEAASKKYESRGVNFRIADIEESNSTIWKTLGTFDLITSFFCFNLVKNRGQAYKNVYNALNKDGQFVMVALATNAGYDAVIELSSQEDYNDFVNPKNVVSPYFFDEDPCLMLAQSLNAIGFKIKRLELRSSSFDFKNFEYLFRFLQAVNPFKANTQLENKFIKDWTTLMIEKNAEKNGQENLYLMTYELIICVAIK